MTRDIIIKGVKFQNTYNLPLIADDVQAYRIVFTPGIVLTGVTFHVTAFRADGIKIDDVGEVAGNTAYYTIKNNMYNVVGKTKFRLRLADTFGTLTNGELICETIEANGDADLTGDDRVPALSSLIVQTTAAKNLANEATENANIAASAANEARVGLDYVTRSATVTIAASNAAAKSKAAADFVCDGVDEEVLNAALAELPASGGSIELSEGSFYFPTIINQFNVHIQGQGHATNVSGLGIAEGAVYACVSNIYLGNCANEGDTTFINCFGSVQNYGMARIVGCSEIDILNIGGKVVASGSSITTLDNTSGDLLLLTGCTIVELITNLAQIKPSTEALLNDFNDISTLNIQP